MTEEQKNEALAYTKEILDDIDIELFAYCNTSVKTISMLMYRLEDVYDDFQGRVRDNEYLKGNLFNCMSEYEFIDYLRERYGDEFYDYEVTETHFKFN